MPSQFAVGLQAVKGIPIVLYIADLLSQEGHIVWYEPHKSDKDSLTVVTTADPESVDEVLRPYIYMFYPEWVRQESVVSLDYLPSADYLDGYMRMNPAEPKEGDSSA